MAKIEQRINVYKYKNSITPKREDGGLDHRFGKSIKNVIDIDIASLKTFKD